jgi:transposase
LYGNPVGASFGPFACLAMRRYELSDAQWAAIAPLLPPAAETGRPRADDRTTLNGVLWKLCSGAAWRDVPERYGPWRTVNDRFYQYRDDGTFDRILAALRLTLDAAGHIDWTTWMVDATSVRASRVAAGARKGGTPRGPTPRRPTRPSAARGAG